jgi:hypothetical protein
MGGLTLVAGNLYGTAQLSDPGLGLAYERANTASGWKEFEYTFTGRDGANPSSGLLRDSSGHFDGVAGSTFTCGVVFRFTRKGHSVSETVLYNFAGGSDGCGPNGPLVQDPSGNLYGVTLAGGTYNKGIAFEITR